MCGVIVVDAESFRSTWHGRDAYIHDHCLRYCHNFALFYQLLNSNLFIHRMLYSRDKPLVKPMPPGSTLHHISFQSTILVYYLFCNLYFPIYTTKIPKIFILLSSLLQVAVKGLTTPLSRWLQGSWLFVQVLGDLRVVSYWIDTLVLKNGGKYLRYFAASPFPLQGKKQRKLKT